MLNEGVGLDQVTKEEQRPEFHRCGLPAAHNLGGTNGPDPDNHRAAALFGGGFGYSRYGYRGGIGIGGILLIILILYLLLGHGRI